MSPRIWKSLDCISYVLLIVGALNWGLVGFFGFDLVAAIYGPMSIPARFVYALVGLAAIYDVVALPAMMKRWEAHWHHQPAPTHA